VDDNYQLVLNLASLIAEVEPIEKEEPEDYEEVELARPDLPVGTEKNYTEWVDGNESLVRWFKAGEAEVRVERPAGTTWFYYTVDGALERWVSDGKECVYDVPLPEPPFPLVIGEEWGYESDYSFTADDVVYEGSIVGEEKVEGFEDVVGEDGVSYFCARVSYSEVERVTIEGSNLTMETTGTYWLSSDAGTVRQEAATTYYVNGVFSGTERRTLVLTSIRKGQG